MKEFFLLLFASIICLLAGSGAYNLWAAGGEIRLAASQWLCTEARAISSAGVLPVVEQCTQYSRKGER